MSSDLWEKVNYTSPLDEYAGIIREFDLSKANISALRTQEVIDDETYWMLYNAEKRYREIFVGKMERDDENVYKAVAKGIKDAKRMLFEANDVQEQEVLSINNDAVFLAGSRAMQTEFGLYKFNIKGQFIHYLHFSNNLKFFYWVSQNELGEVDHAEIKGISDQRLEREQPFIEFIVHMQYLLVYAPIEEAVNEYNMYCQAYLNRKLSIENYRELNADNRYCIVGYKSMYYVDDVSQKDILAVDPSYNYRLLRDLGKIVMGKYFMKRNI